MIDFKIDGKDKSKHRITYYVRPHDFLEENKKNIIESFSKKYGVDKSLIEVSTKYIDENKKETSCIDPNKIDSIQRPEFQLKLIEKYLDEKGITDVDFKTITEIDSRVNSKVDFGKYEKKGTYKINYIKFDNFLSYGDDNFIDFRDFSGLVLLRGYPANQSGKTTLCNDLIHFALYGRTKSGKADSLAQIFNKFRPEKNEVSVEASITVLGEEYIIERVLTRPEKSRSKNPTIKNSVQYYKVHDGGVKEEIEDIENLKGTSTVETNKALKEAIGNESDFDLMSCINAPNLNEIIYLKDAERSRSMIRWFGLQSIEDKSVIARDIWNKEISKNRYCNIYNRENLKTEKDIALDVIKQNTDKISGLKAEIEKYNNAIDTFKKNLETMMSSLRPIRHELEEIDFHTLQETIKRLIEAGGIEAGKLKAKKEELAGIPEVEVDENRFDKLLSEMQEAGDKISQLKAEISKLEKQNVELENGQYCPVCKRKLDDVDNAPLIAENKAKIEDAKAELNKSEDLKKKLSDEYADFKVKRAQKEERNKVVLQVAAIDVNLSSMRAEYTEKNQLLKDIKANEDAIKKNNEINIEIGNLKTRISNGEKYVKRLEDQTNDLKNENTSKETRNREIDGIIATIEKELIEEKHWKVYNDAIGKDGITKMILRESIPLLNSQIKNMLENSEIDFDVEIRMNDKNEIQFLLKKGEVEAPLASGSGYEQLVSSLVLRTVISQFSMISKPPFIILDEILGSVSSENLPKVRKLFENISSLYDFVFHITHLEDVVDWHNRVITVRKVNNVSSIK